MAGEGRVKVSERSSIFIVLKFQMFKFQIPKGKIPNLKIPNVQIPNSKLPPCGGFEGGFKFQMFKCSNSKTGARMA
jgi:hypothetical protein